MSYSAIARIEFYKHYQAGAIHKEAVRELNGYKNPNYNPTLSYLNYYFERLDIDDSFEKWIYRYREENNIVGRYIENSSNPKSETNAMCQALFTIPTYIDTLSRDDQIKVLGYCYDFFKSEFPDVPVMEAVIHFDEVSPHLQINFLPIFEREHKKRGKEKIFSTTLLMPGKEFFPQFQDRFFEYINSRIEIELTREKGSKAKHLSPKQYREVTEELKSLEKEKSEIKSQVSVIKDEYTFWDDKIRDLKSSSGLDQMIRLNERIRDLENENNLMKSFIGYVLHKFPALRRVWDSFKSKFKVHDYEVQK